MLNIHPNTELELVHIQGDIPDFDNYSKVLIIAANPIDRMTNYAGSGLPFPCADVAFEQTPNYHEASKKEVNLTFKYPNSYYGYEWTNNKIFQKKPPTIYLITVKKGSQISQITPYLLPIREPLPLRTLTHRPGFYNGPEFYTKKEDVIPLTTAENVMRSMALCKAKFGLA